MARKRHPLYREVYQALRGKILSAQYEPGAQIETEPRLAEIHGASLITIRQAVQMLADEGLLVKQQGRGTFVAEAVAKRLRVLGVCGLNFELRNRSILGAYHSDLLIYSQEESTRRGLDFETVWLPTFVPERSVPYLEESKLREFLAFVFVGCSGEHRVLQRVKQLKLRHVVISHSPAPTNTVWLDHDEAMRLAAGVFATDERRPLLVMGQDNLRAKFEAVMKKSAQPYSYFEFPSWGDRLDFETFGYEKMSELLSSRQKIPRLLLLDDVIARGATRAILASASGGKGMEIVLISGKQEIIPLGLPVTYVVHDTFDQARLAFDLLDRQRHDRSAAVDSIRVGFSVFHCPAWVPGSTGKTGR